MKLLQLLLPVILVAELGRPSMTAIPFSICASGMSQRVLLAWDILKGWPICGKLPEHLPTAVDAFRAR